MQMRRPPRVARTYTVRSSFLLSIPIRHHSIHGGDSGFDQHTHTSTTNNPSSSSSSVVFFFFFFFCHVVLLRFVFDCLFFLYFYLKLFFPFPSDLTEKGRRGKQVQKLAIDE